ncbi:hypothetical protein BJ165DRAFT_1474000 [Panaeolus papilionaceus]|nr:hypothetical protein BJ165DRAFT_1474000 [Panaeolus papilionaceus]
MEMDDQCHNMDVEMGGVEVDGEQPQQCSSTMLDKALPMPLPDGGVQYLDIAVAKKVQLIEWCRSFELGVKGNKEDLKERMRLHSQEKLRSAWDSLTRPNAQRMHRGPREGGVSKVKATRKKKNTAFLRREEMFGAATQPVSHHPAAGAANDSLLHQSTKEHVRLLAWADDIMERSPYIPKVERDRLREEAIRRNTGMAKLAPHLETELTSIRKDIASVALLVRSSSSSHSGTPTPQTTPQPESAVPPSAVTSSYNPQSSLIAHNPPAYPSLSLSVPSDANSTFLRTFQLGNGAVISVTEADIPDPPSISFTNDKIDNLNAMWDFTPPHYRDTSPLIVKNIRIPIKHWRDLYKSRIKLPLGRYWKENQWNGIKRYYGKWRIIVARWRWLSHEEFWQDFTHDGTHMAFSSMTTHLSAIRAREDKQLAERARLEYGDQFAAVFCYSKEGHQIVKTRNLDIAKQFRKIKGLESDWDLDGDD